MNDLLQQFVIESREYVQQATDGLLILEKSPGDAERLDEVFRAFHTLKGGAGIVEFAPMERVVHAAENVLSELRSGLRPLTPALVGDCLAVLDRVLQWLDTIEQAGELPQECDGQADTLIERIGSAHERKQSGRTNPGDAGQGWLEALLARNPVARASATTAMRFVPDQDAFYQGEDPFALVSSLPALLALDVQPASEWPSLTAIDPFACNLVLAALTASAPNDVAAHMRGHPGECDIRALEPDAVMKGGLSGRVRDVLVAQVALLRDRPPAHFAGIVGSAGSTAANVLRFSGQPRHAEMIARATEKSVSQGTHLPLLDGLQRVLAIETEPVARVVPVELPAMSAQHRTLRIDAARIDDLVRLTGELTIAKNAVGYVTQLAQAEGNPLAGKLKDRHGVLEHLVAELQRSVLEMRVVPLRSVLQRFPRMLREMSGKLGKSVQLSIDGDDTEADKAIVEMLFEPVLHVLRNAVDHGIEPASERTQLGKPATGTIRIRAMRDGNEVSIEVSDDGRGIDLERVREVARMRNLASDESLRAMTDEELVDLVFAPGFSTASDVTAVSGRGVGMDAVRVAVDRIGGRVSVASRAGLGTTVRFALPYSVMMTHVVTVECGGQVFGIPLDAVVETVRVPRHEIARVGTAHAIALRNRTVPVVELGEVLNVREATDSAAEALIVITAVAGRSCGIRVDSLGERLQVVLKPLDGLLANTLGISGTTMLGDGRVLLVLDVAELLQ